MTNQDNIPGLDIRETIDGQTAPKAKAKAVAAEAPKKYRNDPYLWGLYICFLLISIVELFSASSTEVSSTNVYAPLIRHCIFLGLGFIIVIALQRTHYILFRTFAVPFAVISLGLLMLCSVAGVEINGAQRAISIAGFTIQPAEMVKLAVVLVLARILSKNQTPGGVTNKGIILSAVLVVVFAACLIKDGFTNTMLMMGVSLCMFLIGGIQQRKFWLIVAIYCVCGFSLKMVQNIGSHGESDDFSQARIEATASSQSADSKSKGLSGRSETRENRIERFLAGVHPEDPIDDMNRQVIFSNIAQAHGGLTGNGPGNSRESARLPLAFSDYIFSIIVEDLGFIGGAVLLILYLLVLGRAGRVAYRCSRAFPAFLIMGCAVMIVFQALVHMAITTGVFPVSGQPLPFISKGGTSILIMSAAMGMMMSVSRYAVTSGNKKEIRAELKDLPDDMKAANIAGYTEASN